MEASLHCANDEPDKAEYENCCTRREEQPDTIDAARREDVRPYIGH